MDPQAIVIILGALGGAIGAAFAGYGLYKEKSAPHSRVSGAVKLLWNWLDFTRVDETLIAQLRTVKTLSEIIPTRVRRVVLREVDPDALRGENQSARRRREEAEDDEF